MSYWMEKHMALIDCVKSFVSRLRGSDFDFFLFCSFLFVFVFRQILMSSGVILAESLRVAILLRQPGCVRIARCSTSRPSDCR